MSQSPHDVDVVLVGAGISNLIAARELLAGGKRVTILERGTTEDVGGQCNDAFGGMFFVDTPEQRRVGVKDSVELAWEDWLGYAEFADGDDTQRAWARRYVERCTPDVRDWLVEQGLRFFPVVNWAERPEHGRGNRVPRFHLLWGTGPALVERFRTDLAGADPTRFELRTGHTVTRLLTEGDRVVGVAGDGANGPFEIRAEHVVLGAGGRTGDLAKVRASWPRDPWGEPPRELLRGIPKGVDGAMHDAAATAGADLPGLDRMWVYAAGVQDWDPTDPEHGLSLIPMKSALWMRSDGSRFDPPLLAGYDTRDAVARIAAQEHPWSWAVLNRTILERELTIQGSAFNPGFTGRNYLRVAKDLARGNKEFAQRLIDRSADTVTARTLDELAATMTRLTPDAPIDAAALRRDVEAYDAEIARGKKFFSDPQLVALRNVRSFLNDKLRTAAYRPIVDGSDLVAIRLRLNARKTLGGVRTDLACRVLGPDRAVIPGLYAVGETAGFGGGGMNGHRTLEGTLLGGCVLTARQLAATVLGTPEGEL